MVDSFASAQEQTAEKDDILQMVGFKIGDELFGVDILMVQEIIKDMPVTHIPDTPDFIEGIINLRGSIIPIIDLPKRLNLKGKTGAGDEETWMVIINIRGRITGFIVDQVTRVIKIPESLIQDPPKLIASGLKSHYISGVCKLKTQFLAILDFNRIMAVDEFKRLNAIRRQ